MYKEIFDKYHEDKMLNYYDEEEYWFKFCLEGTQQIKLSDFTHQGTFDLINKQYRTEIIDKIVDDIISFL